MPVQYSRAAPLYTPHAAILIDGNSGFVHDNGVTGGSGSMNDPWIISGWDIAGANVGIEVQHTDAYLVIRNVYLHSDGIGVHLVGVSHARVEFSSLSLDTEGVQLSGSNRIVITRNNMTDDVFGVNVNIDTSVSIGSTNVTIVGNNISNGYWGIWTSANPTESGTNITSNHIWGNSQAGIIIADTNDVVAKNNITSNGVGIMLSATVDSNGTPLPAGLVRGNYVARNTQGILSAGAVGITLELNTLVQNGFEIFAPSKLSAFYDSLTIPSTNTIDGRRLLYYNNCNGVTVDGQVAAEIVVGSCSNVRLTNLQIQNSYSTAIQLGFVHDLNVTDSTFGNDSRALQAEWSDRVGVFQNHFLSNNQTALLIQESGNVTVQGNSFIGNRFTPVQLTGIIHLNFVNNTVYGNVGSLYDGVAISDSSLLLIATNNVRMNGGMGMVLTQVTETTVLGNMIGENGGGIGLTSANGFNMTENSLFYNGLGLYVFSEGIAGIFNTIVYHNNFVFNSQYQASHDNDTFPVLDNGYPSGGNYWSDYSGTDSCTGPSQNICTGPDGIGDTPYRGVVAWINRLDGRILGKNTLYDNYPLMKPFGDFSSDKTPPSWAPGAGLTYSDLALTYATLARASVLLHWPAAVDDTWVQHYMFYQNGTLVTKLPGSVHDYYVTGLSPGTSYSFRIEADDVAGNPSSTGPSVSITTPSRNTVPEGNPPPTGNNTPGTNKKDNQPLSAFMALIASGLSQDFPYLILGGVILLVIGTIPIMRRSRRRHAIDKERRENTTTRT